MAHNRLMAAFDGSTAITPAPIVDLDTPARDNAYMRPYWETVDAILTGVEAMRLESYKYLPKLPAEDDDDYKWRVSVSKFTNVFSDIVEDLSSRPFSEPVKLEQAPTEIEDFAKDVDGAGSDITMFAAQTFFNGVAKALDWIFVDFPVVPPNENGTPRTREQDKKDGIRPFWSHIEAINVLEVRTAFIGGSETLIYIRLFEPANDGKPDRVRIMTRDDSGARWQLYEKTGTVNKQTQWSKVDEGDFSIGVIPMVPFSTARRNGRTWQFYPPMKPAAELQIQLYQDESALKHSKTMSAFVMIAANGITPEYTGSGQNKRPKPLKTGPGRVLYGGRDGKGNAGSFELLEPGAASMTFMAQDNKDTIAQLRELGRQPLTAQSGNLTVITTTVAAQKGNSACQQWAIMEAIALENALKITALWMNVNLPDKFSVEVYHDFDVDAEGKDMATLSEMRKNGDLSQRTYWKEASRRGILSGEFDPDAEEKLLLDETVTMAEDDETDETGNPADPNVVPPEPEPKPPIVT